MPKVTGYLTVYYTIELETDATPETAEEHLEQAYVDGELGVLEDHDWTLVELDGKRVGGSNAQI